MARKRGAIDEQPGGYDPLAETAARFDIEPLRLRPKAEIGLASPSGSGPGAPSMRGGKSKLPSGGQFKLKSEPRTTEKGDRVRKDPAMYHEVGEGVKLSRPLSEMSATYEPTGEMVPRKPVTAEDFKPGDVLMGLPGDRTIAGQKLTGINETKFENPVNLQGGPNFMRMLQNLADKAGWASGKSVISTLLNRARANAEKGGRVFGLYAPMAHGGSDFSTMNIEAIREMMRKANVSEQDIRAFDEEMRAPFGAGKKPIPASPDFPGIMSMGDEWIRGAGGWERRKLSKILNKSEWRNKGFADMGAIRHALTEPDLMHTPSMEAGHNIVEVDPSRSAISALTDPHSTYSTGLPVKGYFGSMDEGIPVPEGWPDWMKTRPEGEAATNRDYTFRLQTPPQVVTQQLIDRLMTRRRQ